MSDLTYPPSDPDVTHLARMIEMLTEALPRTHAYNPPIWISRGQEHYYLPEFFVSCGCGWNIRVGTAVSSTRPNENPDHAKQRATMAWIEHMEGL